MRNLNFSLLAFLPLLLGLTPPPSYQAELAPWYCSEPGALETDCHPDDMPYYEGCSMYCALGSVTLTASSVLPPEHGYTFTADMAHDFDRQTVWTENVPGDGIGESLTLTIDQTDTPEDSPLALTHLYLHNGMFTNEKLFRANSRVKRFKLYVDGTYTADLHLLDNRFGQRVAVPEIKLAGKTTVLKLEIAAAYPGTRYQDVCLTEIQLEGTDHH